MLVYTTIKKSSMSKQSKYCIKRTWIRNLIMQNKKKNVNLVLLYLLICIIYYWLVSHRRGTDADTSLPSIGNIHNHLSKL